MSELALPPPDSDDALTLEMPGELQGLSRHKEALAGG